MIRHVLAATAVLFTASNYVHAQTVNRDDILYILPQWTAFINADAATVTGEIQKLRSRIGPDGPYVKLGFTVYIPISMNDWNVDISSPPAVRAAMASTISEIEAVVAKAHLNGIPIALATLTAIRDLYDPVQRASEAEDVRSMQWYADNQIAAGWWSHSRYARKQDAIQEAYIREMGKVIANLMSRYPDTLVAASGDGEVELAAARNTTIYADYSPFVIAEFRDWIRHAGLYASDPKFSGQGYSLGSRYVGDRTPGEDTNGDGHTLNGDFGTAFQTWNLLHFDWSLDDSYAVAEPHAISLATYSSPGFVPLPGQVAGGFDAPRVPKALDAGDAWWNLWVLFKVTMLQRHNQEFAKWITTSVDPDTRSTVPPARWYSYQIPADYIFNGTPANPNDRWYSSASSLSTADISPYGSLGITAFNIDFRVSSDCMQDATKCFVARTLANVAPVVAARGLRWGVIEWNPGQLPFEQPGASTSIDLYREEMAIVRKYRPSLLVPFAWNDPVFPVNTEFQLALSELTASINFPAPATATPAALRFGTTKAGAGTGLVSTTPPQIVTALYGGPTTPVWTATVDQPWLQITNGPGVGQFTIGVSDPQNVIGASTSLAATLTLSAANLGLTVIVPVTLTVEAVGHSTLPFGSFDTPIDGATGLSGSIAVTGWALDDIGVDHVELWRDLAPGETTPPYNGPGPGNGKVFIANPLFISGARPDVEAAYSPPNPAYPQAYRAGWGYLMLTQGLANQGNGVFTLYAFAYDKEGNSFTLGTKTIAVDNARAVKPFGGIDTPDFGVTVSGGYWNFGWALTPNPNSADPRSCVISNGHVQVSIDSGPLVNVSYGDPRADIAAAFPGFSNGSGAGAAYYIDTTALTNGTHQIGWLVTDSCGRADGIGSRFFTVLNVGGASSVSVAPALAGASAAVADRPDPVGVEHSDGHRQSIYPGRTGIRVAEVEQHERVALQLPAASGAVSYQGYQVVNGARRALPLGSSLDERDGVFYWQPAPGFVGAYDLEFSRTVPLTATGGSESNRAHLSSDAIDRYRVRIVVGPSMRMVVDTPLAGSTQDASFAIAGWALDLAAEDGAGIDTVHAWAYPVGAAGPPIFLGVADVGGARRDVGGTYGRQFDEAGYNLTATGLSAGTYDVVVYAHRSATGTFDAAQVVRVVLR